MRTLWTRLKENWNSPDRALQARMEETLDRIEVACTQRAVAQIQAELRAAAAEHRLEDYTAVLLQGTPEDLSAALLRTRRAGRAPAGPTTTG